MGQEIINLIKFFTQNKRLSKQEQDRFMRLLARDITGFDPEIKTFIDRNREHQHEEFDKERAKYSPLVTADFLSLFNKPSGLKFLTHNFDPETSPSLSVIIDRTNKILSEWSGKIPEGLEKLIKGYVNNGYWIDYLGRTHKFSLSSEVVINWMALNHGLHPIIATDFEEEIQDFRKTIRLVQPNLQYIVEDLVKKDNRFQNIKFEQNDLNRADFYTNVLILKSILNDILKDIEQRDKNATISIRLERGLESPYRTFNIIITHFESMANSFEDVKNKLIGGGGALYGILQKCVGYCDWTIEGVFDDQPRRWRLISSFNRQEFEIIEGDALEGFTHKLTFYKRIE